METTVPQLKWPNKKKKEDGRVEVPEEKKGETEKEWKVLKRRRGGQVKTPGDAVSPVQGQPPLPRTLRPFKSTVFWNRWQSITAIMLMKTQIYVVTIWMLGNDSKFFDGRGYRFMPGCCRRDETCPRVKTIKYHSPWRYKPRCGVTQEFSFDLHVQTSKW